MQLPDRLRTAREHTGLEQKKLALQLGISFRSWQDYELGKSVPGGKVFEALAKRGFNANWLLTGEGAMLQGEASYPLSDGLKAAGTTGELGEGFVHVPRYNVTASAGGGAMIHSEQVVDHLAFRADWVRNALGVAVASLVLINVDGDSMEPTLSGGDLILVNRNVEGIGDNAVYVLRYDGKLVVKRIQRMHDGSVIIKSDNAVYGPETIKGDLVSSLDVVGRVVWCGRRM